MYELSRSQKARSAVRKFKTMVDAVMLRGYYRPTGRTGETLIKALRQISPEIYGSMNDPGVVELKGLEYVIDRMPRGIERAGKIILTAREDLNCTAFEEIIPLKRRRVSYAISDDEFCFVITRGASEIYDIITHITFLTIESQKILRQICDNNRVLKDEWKFLEETALNGRELTGRRLDRAIWNLSIILGRTYNETRASYESFEKKHQETNTNNGLFKIIYSIGSKMLGTFDQMQDTLSIHFTPSLIELLGHHRYASAWAENIKEKIIKNGFESRPLHIISANMHSVKNVLYGSAALSENGIEVAENIYDMVAGNRNKTNEIDDYASRHGCFFYADDSGSNIEVQLIDICRHEPESFHPECNFDEDFIAREKPVILVMDYAFGAQAFDLMDELLSPQFNGRQAALNIKSISVMGKAGILPGSKGDIMLASAHVMEGAGHNYMVKNDLAEHDFKGMACYTGPMVTVLGTSLQNCDLLERFHKSSWRAVGIEMEGGHYQRAVSAAIIRGHIPAEVKTRYAYYASDNPLKSGETLAAGPMGAEGIVPTYKITKAILQKILNPAD